jgi:uncharacterized damage-inducible protein DinB
VRRSAGEYQYQLMRRFRSRSPPPPMTLASIGDVITSNLLRLVYDHWPQYNQRLVDVVRQMTAEQLAIRPAPELMPIWATAAHTAFVRVYWLCGVLGEPGAESTPFRDPQGYGWEDEIALRTTWRIVEGCLDRWTPDMLAETFLRDYYGERQEHTRTSILQRLSTHDAYHCGELSQTLGIHGLPQIDLWGQEPEQELA